MRLLLLSLLSVISAAAATYYVDPTNGSDSNNGLGPDASHASNKPFKTLNHVLRTNATTGGDTIWAAPGFYREVVTFRSNWVGGVVTLRGDPRNLSGFRSASGVHVSPMLCIWTSFTGGDQSPAAAINAALLDLDGYSNFRLENFCLLHVDGWCIEMDVITAGAGRITTNCYFTNVWARAHRGYVVTHAGFSNITQNIYFDNCDFANNGNNGQCVSFVFYANDTGSDWDMNIVFRNCILKTTGANQAVAGSKGNVGNGILGSGFHFTNCTIWGSGGVSTGSSSTNSGFRYDFVGCQIMGNTGVTAQDTNQIYVRDSQIIGSTPWVNLLPGPNVVSNNYSPRNFGAAYQMMGLASRPYYSLSAGNGIVGVSSNYTSLDLFMRPRPTTNSFGAMEVWPGGDLSYGF